MDFQFQYPQYLWALAAVPLLLLLFMAYLLWRRRAVRRMGDARLVKALYRWHSGGKAVFKFVLLLVAFSLGCIAIANPRQPDEMQEDARQGIDVVVALDVSNSMLATDVAPSRLERAQALISKLVDALPNDRVGLVLFAGNAYIQMPLTTDHGAAKLFVSTANPAGITTQGTAIGDALEKSSLAFGEESERFKAVVLVTDGESHDENAAVEAQESAAKGIMINTVGIGSAEGSVIIDANGAEKRDAAGNVVVSKLNEQLLQQIAAATNGTYVNLQSTDAAVEQLVAQLSQVEKKALKDTSVFTYKTFYAWLALPMLLLLVIEMFFPDRKKVKG